MRFTNEWKNTLGYKIRFRDFPDLFSLLTMNFLLNFLGKLERNNAEGLTRTRHGETSFEFKKLTSFVQN